MYVSIGHCVIYPFVSMDPSVYPGHLVVEIPYAAAELRNNRVGKRLQAMPTASLFGFSGTRYEIIAENEVEASPGQWNFDYRTEVPKDGEGYDVLHGFIQLHQIDQQWELRVEPKVNDDKSKMSFRARLTDYDRRGRVLGAPRYDREVL